MMFVMVGNLERNGVFNFKSSRRGSRKKNLIKFRIYDSKFINEYNSEEASTQTLGHNGQ